MSHRFRLGLFFVVSVALHAAALWAAAGRIEPGVAEPEAEIAILDRQLFFRHAPRSERPQVASVSPVDWAAATPGGIVQPSRVGESVVPAPAAAARQTEPELGAPLTAPRHAAAPLDLSTLDQRPLPRREAVARQAESPADRSHPTRLSGATAASSIAAIPPHIERSADLTYAEPARTVERAAGAPPAPQAQPALSPSLPPAADLAYAEPARTAERAAGAPPAPQAQPALSPSLPPAADLAYAEPARTTERAASPQPAPSLPAATPAAPPAADLAYAEPARTTERAASPQPAPSLPAPTPAAPPAADLALAEPARTTERAASLQPAPSLPAPTPAAPPAADLALAEPARNTERAASPQPAPSLPAPTTERAASLQPAPSLPAPTPAAPPAADLAYAEPAEATERAASARPVPRSVGTAPELARSSPTESVDRPAPVAAASRTGERIASAEAPFSPVTSPIAAPRVLAPDAVVAEPAQPMAVEAERVGTSSAWEPAGEAARIAAVPSRPARPARPLASAIDAVPGQARLEPERLAARQPAPRPVPGPAFRGTLPPPLLGPLDGQSAQPVGAGDGSRLAAARADDPQRTLPSETAMPGQVAPSQQPVTARALQTAPASAPSTPSRATPARSAPQDLATRVPVAPASRPEIAGQLDPTDQFTTTYLGGECFFPLRTVSGDDDVIIGYAVRSQPVLEFRQAFMRAFGMDPALTWQPITEAQCSGISFTRVVLRDSAPNVHIDLDRDWIESGEELTGRVSGGSFDFVTLLMLDDDGMVHNILEHLRSGPVGFEFSAPVYPISDAKHRAQLVIAVAASMPLPALQSTAVTHGEDYFAELFRQAEAAEVEFELGLKDFMIVDEPPPGAGDQQ